MTVLRVKDWSDHFENNRTRELKDLNWVPIPNKHDGDGYTDLLDHHDGAAHFGAWNAIVQVASKCKPRGALVRENGEPHTAKSLARITRIPKAVFDGAIPRLIEIGWLETHDMGDPQVTTEQPEEVSHVPAAIPQGVAEKRLTNGTEGNGMEANGNERKSVAAVLLGEGIKPDDPILSEPCCTPEQVQIAIANADAYAPGKLADRKCYIIQAIRKGYKLSAKAGKRAEAEKHRHAQAARKVQEQAEQKRVADNATVARDAVTKLPDDVFKRLAAQVFQSHPQVQGFVKCEKESGWLQLKVYELLKQEKPNASACA